MSDGRRRRFEDEVLVHAKVLYSAAFRLSRREDDARDLSQESLLRAYRTFDGFTPGTNARAWLLTILYSVFINKYRRERRLPGHVSIEELESRYARELAAPSTGELRASRAAWSAADVESALAELPEAFRHTIQLVDVEELTYEEAATALECAVGTVRSRLFRARRLLAASLRATAERRGMAAKVTGTR
jgi:RNA polymerase sigma-70 factor (ECF subfamily)